MTRKRKHSGVGARLQEARERRGISLRQIADSTKISVSVLQALERNDISQLPGGVVGRGFVRSFAAAVNLDPEATVAEFVAQFPLGSVADGYPATERIDGKELPDSRPTEVPIKIHRWAPPTLLRVAAVGVLAGALVVYFVTPTLWSYWAAAQSRAGTPQANLAADRVRGAGSDERSRQLLPSGQQPAPDLPATVTAPTTSVEPPAPPLRPPPPVAGAPPSVAVSPAPTLDRAPGSSPANARSSANANDAAMSDAGTLVVDTLTVVLSATAPCWVIVAVDGTTVVNRLLEIGEQQTLEARRDLVLTAGDGGAIVMTLNGAAAKPLGRTGETVKVHVNRTNFRDYLHRDDSPLESP